MTEIRGTVLSAATQWWLKVNRKPVRAHALDGAEFPHIVTVGYTVDGIEYRKRKWLRAGAAVPAVGSRVTVFCDPEKPSRAQVVL